jgi:hypothetical protein
MNNKTIITPSLMQAIYEVEEAVLAGYRVSQAEPPYMLNGAQFCVEMENTGIAIPSFADAIIPAAQPTEQKRAGRPPSKGK